VSYKAERRLVAAEENRAFASSMARVDRLIGIMSAINSEAQTTQYGALLRPVMEGMSRVMANAMAADTTAGSVFRAAELRAQRDEEVRTHLDDVREQRKLRRTMAEATFDAGGVLPPPRRDGGGGDDGEVDVAPSMMSLGAPASRGGGSDGRGTPSPGMRARTHAATVAGLRRKPFPPPYAIRASATSSAVAMHSEWGEDEEDDDEGEGGDGIASAAGTEDSGDGDGASSRHPGSFADAFAARRGGGDADGAGIGSGGERVRWRADGDGDDGGADASADPRRAAKQAAMAASAVNAEARDRWSADIMGMKRAKAKAAGEAYFANSNTATRGPRGMTPRQTGRAGATSSWMSSTVLPPPADVSAAFHAARPDSAHMRFWSHYRARASAATRARSETAERERRHATEDREDARLRASLREAREATRGEGGGAGPTPALTSATSLFASMDASAFARSMPNAAIPWDLLEALEADRGAGIGALPAAYGRL